MPDTMTIGLWLFWFGVGAAYAGTLWLPSAAKSRKIALWLLILSAASGWAAMFVASSLSGYGQAWLDMRAAYIGGGLTAFAGAVLVFSRPKEEQ